MNTSRVGAEAEREFRQLLESRGFKCMRTAASKGDYDLIACKRDEIRFIQVKKIARPTVAQIRQLDQTTRAAMPCLDSRVIKIGKYVAILEKSGWLIRCVDEMTETHVDNIAATNKRIAEAARRAEG